MTNHYHSYFQIIFRKVADVKKEKELAEKRKNDPPLELSNDHPVRKLISRFRKMGDVKGSTNDLEKGGPRILSHDRAASGSTKIINVSEQSTAVNSVSKLGGGASKWGKLLSGAGIEGRGVNSLAYRLPETSAQEEALKKASEKPERNNETSRSIIRNVAKLNKVLENQPPSIDEAPENEQKCNLKKTESQDSGILKSNKTLDQISNSSDGSQCSRHQSGGTLSVAEQQMLTSLYDIKLEFKEEMEIMHQKMNRIDEQISEILRMFSPTVSQCSSHVTSCACSHGCSKFTSPHNTSTNSVEHSPKTSLTSSPRRVSQAMSSGSEKQSELVSMCDDVINMDVSQPVHAYARDSNQEKDKARMPKNSNFRPPLQQTDSLSEGHSVHRSTNPRKTNRVSPEVGCSDKSSRKSTPSPAPVEAPLTTRDIDIPLKDRDLDIL